MENIKSRIELLRDEIRRHDELYYIQNRPEITDTQYNAMFEKLIQLETEYPEYADPNSPTNRIGSDIKNVFTKHPHPLPMQSIKSYFDENEALEALQKTSGPYFINAKYDGIAIEIHYHNGIIKRALTRGNGYHGNDVTANIRTISAIPQKINVTGKCIVRGEIFLTRREFNRLNQLRKRSALEPYNNIRSAAGSLVMASQSSQTAIARLSAVFFFYHPVSSNQHPASTDEQWSRLNELGFPIPKAMVAQTPESALKAAIQIATGQNSPPSGGVPAGGGGYPTDGAVIKTINVQLRENARYQEGAFAIKTNSPVWQTTLRFVAWNVSQHGKLTPVAHFMPFFESGSTFTKAIIYPDQIETMNLHNNATIQVQISGFVIPKVIAANGGDTPVAMPTVCPCCHQPLTNDRCENTDECPAFGNTIADGKFNHWPVCIDLPEIEGDGPALYRAACSGLDALIVQKSRNSHQVCLVTTSYNIAAEAGIRIGKLLPGPFHFEKATHEELEQLARTAIMQSRHLLSSNF